MLDSVLIPATADAPPSAALQIDTVPAASSVWEGNLELCPITPCAIFYDGPDAAPESVHVLTIAREGYRSETRRVTASDTAITVALLPATGPRRSAPPAPKDTSQALLSGYRLEIPY